MSTKQVLNQRNSCTNLKILKIGQLCSFGIGNIQKKFHTYIYVITSRNKKKNILLDLANTRFSSSYKGQLVLKFLHNTKHGI